MTSLALAWFAGVALHLHERALMPPSAYMVLLAAALALAATGWRSRWWWLGLPAALLLALGLSGLHASSQMGRSLPSGVENRDIEVTGVVASLPQRSSAGIRFRFDIESATLQGRPVDLPIKASLGWYAGWHEDATLTEPQLSLAAGQRWRFAVKLRQPHGNVNPHGFDYELYLFEQGVRATGAVRDGPNAPRLIEDDAMFSIDRWRQRVRDAIDASVDDKRAAGVLAALAVGDQSAIERDDWQLFRNTGVAHLMSISGLHVTMFAWLAGLAVASGWRRSTRLMLALPSPLAARWGGLIAASAYAMFSGWGVPAQRTVWMLAAVVILRSSGKRWPWALVLMAAAVVVSVADPWALLQPGFWLSFVAVGVLMASQSVSGEMQVDDERWWHRLWRHMQASLRTQVIATLSLAPLTLVFFQQLSIVGFAANLVAIPLITLVVTPLALLGVAFTPLWQLGAAVQTTLADGLAWLGQFPAAVWQVPVAPLWAQAAGLSAGLLLVLPLPWRVRALALPLVMPLLMPPRDLPAPGSFDVLAVDVGQGTAVVVRTSRHVMVYDSGPQYSRDSDAGQRVLLPLLRALGESRIDTLVLSHRDLDHVGGASAMLQNLPVQRMLSSLEDGHPLLAQTPNAGRCVDGQSWQWDGVRFDVLRPMADDYARSVKSNGMSCVVKVSAAQGSVLLTGDIERQQEAEIVNAHRAELRSDVLLVPHHGSRTSSTAGFLDAVTPQVAIVQAGYLNRFGHPVDEIVERLKDRGAAIHASPGCGAWRWQPQLGQTAASDGLCQRDTSGRYWHHRLAGDLVPRSP